MNAIKDIVHNATPSGLNMFTLDIHNYYIPSGLIPGPCNSKNATCLGYRTWTVQTPMKRDDHNIRTTRANKIPRG
jgi:hypothetical protein